MEVGGVGKPSSGGLFHTYRLNTARWFHWESIKNSTHFDGQVTGQSCGDFQLGGYTCPITPLQFEENPST